MTPSLYPSSRPLLTGKIIRSRSSKEIPVAQALFWWKQILNLSYSSSPQLKFKSRALKTFSRLCSPKYGRKGRASKSVRRRRVNLTKPWKRNSLNQLRSLTIWLICPLAFVAMLVCNWKLAIATVVGIAIMLLVYSLQNSNWRISWSDLQQFLRSSHGKLTLAVGSGGLATITTYTATCLWIQIENRWLATGAILQGFGTLITLALLIWQIIARQIYRTERNFEQLLQNLTQPDPLKRLIAVRQLTHFVTNIKTSDRDRTSVAEYFRLMLSQEQEIFIQDAILEGLQALNKTGSIPKDSQPLQIPVNLKHRFHHQELEIVD
ncbi:hypothetical protein [Oscillatoria salina]|uniref:hypothetical protein n=1 Tax=Oscillatoria salina TaxID=331517 RepID=UPI001CCFF724|nr:hypothetical protein [Oscillatoria salina]MBZ8181409.1 hypothetical protein [Oscillatoria salina IIICB1]